MDRRLDRYEQYSRRNCLLIHGVKVTDEVVIKIFEKKMKEIVSANDIDSSHRLGKKIFVIILSSNFPGTMSVVQFLEKRKA